jgi:hypothetical protein
MPSPLLPLYRSTRSLSIGHAADLVLSGLGRRDEETRLVVDVSKPPAVKLGSKCRLWRRVSLSLALHSQLCG